MEDSGSGKSQVFVLIKRTDVCQLMTLEQK